MVGVALLADFDIVGLTVLRDKVVEVVVHGFAGSEHFVAKKAAEGGVLGRHGGVSKGGKLERKI